MPPICINPRYLRVCMYLCQVFCQLIRQTAGVAAEEIDSPGVLSIWQTLSCMVCTFIPERAIKRYLTMHIKKSVTQIIIIVIEIVIVRRRRRNIYDSMYSVYTIIHLQNAVVHKRNKTIFTK